MTPNKPKPPSAAPAGIEQKPTDADLLNLPWHVVEDEAGRNIVADADYERIREETSYMGHRVAEVGDWNGKRHDPNNQRACARASFIVLACNAYDSHLAALAQARERNEKLVAALKDLDRAYVSLLESARDRIVSLGGQCDPLEVMERGDPYLAKARAALSLPPQSVKP